MNTTKLKLGRILHLNEAVKLVLDVPNLDGKVAYSLGRLGDFCESPIKSYNKKLGIEQKNLRDKQTIITKQLKDADEETRKKLTAELGEILQKYNDIVDPMLDVEEEIKVPSFKLSDFIAKYDVTLKDGTVIKTGESLVPIKFYGLMGDLITDET